MTDGSGSTTGISGAGLLSGDCRQHSVSCQAANIRRQVRGFGAAVIITMLLANFNLRKIAAFMSDQYKEDAKQNLAGNPVEKKLRRRDRDVYNRYTDTLPPGVERPKHLKKRGAATNDTGGPPTTE